MRGFDLDLLAMIALLEEEIGARAERPRDWGLSYRQGLRDAGQRIHERAEREYGPRISALYDNGYDDATRKRVSRALARMEAAGLVWRSALGYQATNATHVRTTQEGRRLLEAPPGEARPG